MGRQKVDLAALRADTAARAGYVCEWAGCSEQGEEMAHLQHRGMGGNPDQSRNVLRNTAWLCRYHHDIFDRREIRGTKEAMRLLLTAYLRLERKT